MVSSALVLGGLGSNITDPINVPYNSIPHFPSSKKPGDQIIAGNMGGRPVIIMQGRHEFFDGYTTKECTIFVRVLKLLGIENVIIIDTARAIHPDYKVGDAMLVKDHVNLMGFTGQNPLMGTNDERFGPRFIPLNKAYDKELLTKANEVLQEINFEGTVHGGVYAVVSGPASETISENNFLKTCGIDAVGTTIVPDVMVAKHCSMGVLALNVITDESVLDYDGDKEVNQAEVLEMCSKRTEQLNGFLEKYIPAIVGFQPVSERTPDVLASTCCKCKKHQSGQQE